MTKVKINEIEVGDVFGESSTYRVKSVNQGTIIFTHIQSGKEVELSHGYVTDLLYTADQYQSEVSVGLLDKVWTDKQVAEAKKKDPQFHAEVSSIKQIGIKTIWSEVGAKPFTVCFEKKGKDLSQKAYNTKVQEVTDAALEQINQAQAGRKGVAKTAAQIIEDLIRNPIVNYEKGTDRVLRGIKLQHESTDGFYQVTDLDITTGETKRLVNLNTIKWLVVDGVKYIVE